MMKTILQVFVPVQAGATEHKPILPQPMEFSSAELHSLSQAINFYVSQHPGLPTAKTAAFKVDAVRGAANRWVRENS
jgi:hypothetical protein